MKGREDGHESVDGVDHPSISVKLGLRKKDFPWPLNQFWEPWVISKTPAISCGYRLPKPRSNYININCNNPLSKSLSAGLSGIFSPPKNPTPPKMPCQKAIGGNGPDRIVLTWVIVVGHATDWDDLREWTLANANEFGLATRYHGFDGFIFYDLYRFCTGIVFLTSCWKKYLDPETSSTRRASHISPLRETLHGHFMRNLMSQRCRWWSVRFTSGRAPDDTDIITMMHSMCTFVFVSKASYEVRYNTARYLFMENIVACGSSYIGSSFHVSHHTRKRLRQAHKWPMHRMVFWWVVWTP